MAEKKDKSDKAELRTRWREFMDDGSLARLRSEGRLVAHYVFLVGNWTTCEIRFTKRQAARSLGVHPNTVRRGVQQMIDAGILEILENGQGTSRTRFRVTDRARAVPTPGTSGAHSRARAVTGVNTSGAHSGHEPCPERARVVPGVGTGGAHNSVLVSVSSVRRDSDCSVAATAGAGSEPARRRRKRWENGLAVAEAPAEPQEANADA